MQINYVDMQIIQNSACRVVSSVNITLCSLLLGSTDLQFGSPGCPSQCSPSEFHVLLFLQSLCHSSKHFILQNVSQGSGEGAGYSQYMLITNGLLPNPHQPKDTALLRSEEPTAFPVRRPVLFSYCQHESLSFFLYSHNKGLVINFLLGGKLSSGKPVLPHLLKNWRVQTQRNLLRVQGKILSFESPMLARENIH